MVNGNNVKVQLGKESTYATVATPTNQIKVASEGFKYIPEKKSEGLFTGGKSTGKTFTMSKKVEGALSTIARPDDVGLFLGLVTGIEATPVVNGTLGYDHVFTAIGSGENDYLPSVTAFVDRIVEQYSYTGLILDGLSFDASPGDFLKLDCKFTGREESANATLVALTASPLKAFKFADAKVKIQGSSLADVTSLKFDYQNKVESIQTTDTGYYFTKAKQGAREISSEIEVIYSAGSDTIYNTLFKTDDVVSLEITFTSEEEIETGLKYSLVISIPNMQINDCSANIGGAEIVKQNMKLSAIEEGSDELITIKLTNARATKYI